MILECTECRTRYLVPDTAIGSDGRVVRCAACKHSWFQAGPAVTHPPVRARPPMEAEPASFAAAPIERPAADAVPADGAPIGEATGGEAAADVATAAPLPTFQDEVDAGAGALGYDAFAHQPPFRARRNPARRWTIAAFAAGAAMIVALGAIAWSGAPGLAQRFGIPIGSPDTPLRLIDNPIERRDLANGSEMFAVSGKVVNPSATRQRVPDIRAELRDAQDRIVYSWTIRPEAAVMAPRTSLDFNSAKLDVPVNSKKLVMSFSGEAAH